MDSTDNIIKNVYFPSNNNNLYKSVIEWCILEMIRIKQCLVIIISVNKQKHIKSIIEKIIKPITGLNSEINFENQFIIDGITIIFNNNNKEQLLQYEPYHTFEYNKTDIELLSLKTLDEFGIPEDIREDIIAHSFIHIICRKNKKFKNNKFKTIHSLIKTIREIFKGEIIEIDITLQEWIMTNCKRYFNDILKQDINTLQIVENIKILYNSMIALAEMNMPYLDDSGMNLIYITNENLANKYPTAFETFKNIGICLPCPEITSGYKLIQLLKMEKFYFNL